MQSFFQDYFRSIINETIDTNICDIETLTEDIIITHLNGGTIWICGNGGSMCSAQHFAEDCVKCIREKSHNSVKCMAIGSNNGYMTCISNDLGYDKVFTYELETFADFSKDLVIGLSVSGNSKNVLNALELASNRGGKTASITGFNGDNKIARMSRTSIKINSRHFGIVEDMTMMYLHAIAYCLMNDKYWPTQR